MKSLKSPLFQKFENDEMKNLQRVVGGQCVATYDSNCNETDSVEEATVGDGPNGTTPVGDFEQCYDARQKSGSNRR